MGTSLFIIGSKALMREKQKSSRYYRKSRYMFDDISWLHMDSTDHFTDPINCVLWMEALRKMYQIHHHITHK